MSEQATNNFQDGLSLDMSPLIDSSKTLRNCLNGTIVTFKGNEYILQNDYGNSRIIINKVNNTEILDDEGYVTGNYNYSEDSEYIQLSEGFIPIGVKVYNDVMYIASYNPETGKGELGSFPSPDYDNIQVSTTVTERLQTNHQYSSSFDTKSSCTVKQGTEQYYNIVILLQDDNSESMPISICDYNQTNFGSNGNKYSSQNRLVDLSIKIIYANSEEDITNKLLTFDTVVKSSENPTYDIINSNYINAEYTDSVSSAINSIQITTSTGFTIDSYVLTKNYIDYNADLEEQYIDLDTNNGNFYLTLNYNAPDGGDYLNISSNLPANENYNKHVNVLAKFSIYLNTYETQNGEDNLLSSELIYQRYFPEYTQYTYDASSELFSRIFPISKSLFDQFELNSDNSLNIIIKFEGLKSLSFDSDYEFDSSAINVESYPIDDKFYLIDNVYNITSSLKQFKNPSAFGSTTQFYWLYASNDSKSDITIYYSGTSASHVALLDLNLGIKEEKEDNAFLLKKMTYDDDMSAWATTFDNNSIDYTHNYLCFVVKINDYDSYQELVVNDIQYFMPMIQFYKTSSGVSQVTSSETLYSGSWATGINFTPNVSTYRNLNFSYTHFSDDGGRNKSLTYITDLTDSLYYNGKKLSSASNYIYAIENDNYSYEKTVETIPLTLQEIGFTGVVVNPGVSTDGESNHSISNLSNFINFGNEDGEYDNNGNFYTVESVSINEDPYLHLKSDIQNNQEYQTIIDTATRSMYYMVANNDSYKIDSEFIEYETYNQNNSMSINLNLDVTNANLVQSKTVTGNLYENSLTYADISRECITIYLTQNSNIITMSSDLISNVELDHNYSLVFQIKDAFSSQFSAYSGLFFKVDVSGLTVNIYDDSEESDFNQTYFYLFIPSNESKCLYSLDDSFVSTEQSYYRYYVNEDAIESGTEQQVTISYYDFSDNKVQVGTDEVTYLDNLIVRLDFAGLTDHFYYLDDDGSTVSDSQINDYVFEILEKYNVSSAENNLENYIINNSYRSYKIKNIGDSVSVEESYFNTTPTILIGNGQMILQDDYLSYVCDLNGNVVASGTNLNRFDYQVNGGTAKSDIQIKCGSRIYYVTDASEPLYKWEIIDQFDCCIL